MGRRLRMVGAPGGRTSRSPDWSALAVGSPSQQLRSSCAESAETIESRYSNEATHSSGSHPVRGLIQALRGALCILIDMHNEHHHSYEIRPTDPLRVDPYRANGEPPESKSANKPHHIRERQRTDEQVLDE